MNLSCEAFPELSILLVWRYDMDVEAAMPAFGPWLLPLTSPVALVPLSLGVLACEMLMVIPTPQSMAARIHSKVRTS